MKSLSSASFFRAFDLLVGKTNSGQKLDDCTIDDVRFVRERHSFSGRTHCFAIDVFTTSNPGRRRRTLTAVKEYWWDGAHKRSIKTPNRSQPLEGNRRDIMAWLRDRENALSKLGASHH